MKRNHEIRIRLTEQEFRKAKEKAQSLGLTISGLIRIILQISNISPTIVRQGL